MEKYISQLTELLQEAQHRRPTPRYLDLPEEMEGLEDIIDAEMAMAGKGSTLEQIFGIEQYYFPPEERLSDSQIKTLVKEILDLWHVYHYKAVMRKGELSEREIYTKLIGFWKDSFPLFRGSNGTWYVELFDYKNDWDGAIIESGMENRP